MIWKSLSDRIRGVSTGRVALSALIVFVLFTALVLPVQAARAEAYTGDSGSPDQSFYYTATDLYHWAEAYGPEGRAAYIRARFTFDLIWPLLYTLFLATAISWLNRRAFGADSPWQQANLVPVLGMIFDYLENASASLVMIRYPAATPIVDGLATVFTMVKWFFVYGSFVLLLAGTVLGLWQWVRKSRK